MLPGAPDGMLLARPSAAAKSGVSVTAASINHRIDASRRERRVLARVTRAAWRLEQAERERAWALVSARAEGISIRTLAKGLGCHRRECTRSWPGPTWTRWRKLSAWISPTSIARTDAPARSARAASATSCSTTSAPRILGQLLTGRTTGPIFLSARIAAEDGTVDARDVDPVSRRRRMTYRTADRHLAAATGGWDLHDLRHSRLTHAGEDGATEADLMNLSGHEDRRTLQRYLKPSKGGTHRRLDDIDARRGAWTPGPDELAERLTRADKAGTDPS